MNVKNLLPLVVTGLVMMSSSCIDSDYDLSDIDTTTRVNVNSLVIPINIDKIQLKSIIDVNEDDPNASIKVIDGAYTYVKEGDFNTSSINVYTVTFKSATSSKVDLNLPLRLPALSEGIIDPIKLTLPIPQQQTKYLFKAYNVSQDICGLTKVTGKSTVDIYVKISGLENTETSYQFRDFVIDLPKGMELSDCKGATYNAANHTLTINTTTSQPSLHIVCTASAFNIFPGEFDAEMHLLSVEGQVGIASGDLVVDLKEPYMAIGMDHLGLTVDYSFGDTNIESVDGVLKYSIDNVNIPDINIDNLPDVLQQPGTNLILTNPQIYLSVNNPLYVCGAYAQTGLEITSVLGTTEHTYTIDEPYFTIPAKATDYFCFSPSKPTYLDPSFPDCVHVGYKALSKVLSGEQIPDKLKVSLVNPCMPEQKLSGFLLGHDYGRINGRYKFVAPLQFDKGSCVEYSDKLDGWSSEDLDKMTITSVTIALNISTDIPMGVSLSASLLDKKGQPMIGVNSVKVDIAPNAQNQQIEFTIAGDIHDLDGVDFKALAAADANGKPLSPDMTITLSNIRPTVTGYYQTEL